MKKYGGTPVVAGEDEPFLPVGASAFSCYDCEVISLLSNKLETNTTPVTSPSFPSSDGTVVTLQIDPDEGLVFSRGEPEKGNLKE